ncbi:hypothetical protein CPT_Sansa116 [Caulobacter phage Sansa]|uniref:Uncharacterized protein n=1 Tax=Caulobacter phage Sansa TaxID=1675600 RepID=A0A0K1LMK5_9CAUD|nr:hypothetical protein HOR07_gp001 [Caulobacter phage Sansa]YP_009785504.1 hypothetical protein HOR07_gp116 [Caulobacter phage Sansa]AKU43405.1 hypothetical protein CPT_Sansa1 [Caulobacter phage Sansa]AKU43520.1 hypothetical protein CPT_Sansa116 [Caulobacter phage Sansa]
MDQATLKTIIQALHTSAAFYREAAQAAYRRASIAEAIEAASHFNQQARDVDAALEAVDRMNTEGPQFSLWFGMGNDAFAQEPEQQAAEILRQIAESVESGNRAGNVRDQNGNTVGNWDCVAPGD